jgi:hypothetical protein
MKKPVMFIGLMVAVSLLVGVTDAGSAPGKPNVVLILSDFMMQLDEVVGQINRALKEADLNATQRPKPDPRIAKPVSIDSKVTEYDIMASPYKRDIVRGLAEACHRQGMRLGLYYSTRDWYHPEYLVGDNKSYDRFYRAQIQELLSNYGRVDIMWFDHVGGRDWGKWQFDALFALVKPTHLDTICG